MTATKPYQTRTVTACAMNWKHPVALLSLPAIMTLLLMKTMAAASLCPGCTDESACYDPSALQDDGSCLTLDECGVCGGEGIPEGNCDCDGNVLDALGECGGISEQEFELCLGNNEYQIFSFCAGDDAVNTINFTGGFLEPCCDFIAVYDGADATAPLIALTNGDLTGQSFSSTNAEGCITIELTSDGSVSCATGSFDPLTYTVLTFDFCSSDDDSDGICDDQDDCVGQYDECGVCNGPGAIYDCGCSGPEQGYCDCDGNVLNQCGECGGEDLPFLHRYIEFFSQLSSGQTDSQSTFWLANSTHHIQSEFLWHGGSYPGDMMVYLYAPNGDCIVWAVITSHPQAVAPSLNRQ